MTYATLFDPVNDPVKECDWCNCFYPKDDVRKTRDDCSVCEGCYERYLQNCDEPLEGGDLE